MKMFRIAIRNYPGYRPDSKVLSYAVDFSQLMHGLRMSGRPDTYSSPLADVTRALHYICEELTFKLREAVMKEIAANP